MREKRKVFETIKINKEKNRVEWKGKADEMTWTIIPGEFKEEIKKGEENIVNEVIIIGGDFNSRCGSEGKSKVDGKLISRKSKDGVCNREGRLLLYLMEEDG